MKYLLLIWLLIGCGDDSSSSAAKLVDDAFLGTWRTSCMVDGEISQRVIRVHTDGQMRLVHSVYYDKLCTVIGTDATLMTSYELVDMTTSPYKINYTVDSYTLTIRSESFVDYANTNKFFGYTNWAVGVTKDVAGKSPATGDVPYEAVGDVMYGVYKIKANELYVGDTETLDGTTEAKRPIVINEDLVFTKE